MNVGLYRVYMRLYTASNIYIYNCIYVYTDNIRLVHMKL